MKLVLVSLLLVITVFSSAEVQENKADFALKLLKRLYEERASMEMAGEVEERRRGGEKEQKQKLVTRQLEEHKSKCGCSHRYETSFKGSCYRFVTTPTTWFEAEDICKRDGGALVSIETQEEQDHLVNYIVGHPHLKNGVKLYWISATDMTKTGTYVWKGTGWPVDYKNFAPGQPNGPPEHCLVLWNAHNWKWADYGCQYNKFQQAAVGYICEKPANSCIQSCEK